MLHRISVSFPVGVVVNFVVHMVGDGQIFPYNRMLFEHRVILMLGSMCLFAQSVVLQIPAAASNND
jgi:hypothetical protein